MTLVLEYDRRQLKPPLALHEDLAVRIDQDIIDGRVLEERLERTKADHLVDDIVGDLRLFALVELDAISLQQPGDDASRLFAKRLRRELLNCREVDLLEQPLVQPDLDVGVDAAGGIQL